MCPKMNSTKFRDILKLLRFPDYEKFPLSDFDLYFSDENMSSFLETFSNLNENNVLTKEELIEFNSLSAADLSFLENCTSDGIVTESEEESRNEEVKFLQESLSLIEEHNSLLLNQKKELEDHKNVLLEQKEEILKRLGTAKKWFDACVSEKVPQEQSEVITTLISIIENVDKMDSMRNNMFSSNLADLETYFEKESEIVDCISGFVNNSIEFQESNDNINLNVPGLSQKELLIELEHLNQVVIESRLSELESASECKKLNTELKEFNEIKNAVLGIPTSCLWSKLQEEKKANDQLKEKERGLMQSLSNYLTGNINKQCHQVAVARAKEIQEFYCHQLERIQQPLKQMVNQRSRLELCILCLNVLGGNLKNVKHLIDCSSDYIQDTNKSLLFRKDFYENQFHKENFMCDQFLPKDSIAFSIFKILNNHEVPSQITLENVLHLARQVRESDQYAFRVLNERLAVIDIIEKQHKAINDCVSHDQEYFVMCKYDSDVNAMLNKLSLKLDALGNKFAECKKNRDQKQKLLEMKRNLHLGRTLFVSALLDEERFHKIVDEIAAAGKRSLEADRT